MRSAVLLGPGAGCVLRVATDTAGRMDPEALDAVLADVAAQRALLATGEAIVGWTRLDGRVALKLTFVNRLAREEDAHALLDLIAAAGARAAA